MTLELVKQSNSRWIWPYKKIRLVKTIFAFINTWYRSNTHFCVFAIQIKHLNFRAKKNQLASLAFLEVIDFFVKNTLCLKLLKTATHMNCPLFLAKHKFESANSRLGTPKIDFIGICVTLQTRAQILALLQKFQRGVVAQNSTLSFFSYSRVFTLHF